MQKLFDVVMSLDYLMAIYPEQEEMFYDMQETLMRFIEDSGLRQKFDDYIEENGEMYIYSI